MATRTGAAPTKRDQTRQAELSIGQQNAIDALVLGATDAEAATAAGVGRQTVLSWRHNDALFQATLNTERAAIWSASTDQLRAMVPPALAILAAALAERPDTRLAMDILKLAGVGEGAHLGTVGIGPTTVAEIESNDAAAAERIALADLCRVDVSHLPRRPW